MVSPLYVGLVVAVAVQRMLEVRISRRHQAALLDRGGVEHATGQMPVMVALHTLWLSSCLYLGLFVEPQVPTGVWVVALALFIVGQTLRIVAMRTLGERWTVTVLTLPGAPPVSGGIFRYIRHPNYLGVVLEVAALPLIYGAYLTAIVFTLANGILLFFRIRAEESALSLANGYDVALAGRPRMVPTLRTAHTGEQPRSHP